MAAAHQAFLVEVELEESDSSSSDAEADAAMEVTAMEVDDAPIAVSEAAEELGCFCGVARSAQQTMEHPEREC